MQELANRFIYKDGLLISKVTGKPTGVQNNWGYIRVTWDRGTLGRVREYAHRLIWFMFNGAIPDNMLVDHINLDKTDNRIENLRLVDKSGNAQNSKWRGYWLDKRSGLYRAVIRLHGKTFELGMYASASDARAAYLKEKAKLHPYASKHVLI